MQAPQQIAFVAHWSKDLVAQREFFADVMGFTIEQAGDDAVVMGGGGQPRIVLHRASGPTAHLDGETHIGYVVGSVDRWLGHLTAKGATILAKPARIGDGRRSVVVRTPAGQSIALLGA